MKWLPSFRIIFLSLFFTFGTIIIAFGFIYGKTIPFKQQWPLYEALRTTAAIIFAVVGAWLAIIYPDRFRLAFQTKEKNEKNGFGLSQVLSPVIHSTAILCIILTIGILAPIASQISFLQIHKDSFRGLSYSLLCFLTLWQLASIYKTLPIAHKVKKETDIEKQNQKTINNMFSNTQQRDD